MNKAQSFVEYGVCLFIVIMAAAAISTYVKRGMQGRYEDVVNAAQKAANNSAQYEPYYADSVAEFGNTKDVAQSIRQNNYRQNAFTESATVKAEQAYPLKAD